MPPKRAADQAASKSKKSRPSTDAADTSDPETLRLKQLAAVRRNKRWAPVSGSANADAEVQLAIQNPVKAYSFVCMCQPPFSTGDSDEEDEEDDDKPRCDGGKTCLCDKPAADHPDHKWKLSVAGRAKFYAQRIHCDLRDPDNFHMYTCNDHSAYGVLEVVQNLLLDFDEAANNWKDQWAVCEALAFLLNTGIGESMATCDDSTLVTSTYELVGHAFLCLLARLEHDGLLGNPDSPPVENLGLIMALHIAFVKTARAGSLMEDPGPPCQLGPREDKVRWFPHQFDKQIVAYAHKYQIQLRGPGDIDDMVSALGPEALTVRLPKTGTGGAVTDPFNFAKTFKEYKQDNRHITSFMSKRKGGPKTAIGGDALDITTWTPAERKQFNFDKKDPFSKEEIAAIKKGLVIQMG